MYRQPLNSPPPQSQFRRPWSPDPYDALQSTNTDYYDPYNNYPPDVSVEALDLADYQSTLRPHAYPDYPPLPASLNPLPTRDSFPPPPPSLVSDRYTSSTQSHSSRTPTRRPFSHPPPSHSATSPLTHSSNNHHSPHIVTADPPSEIDISQFPRFSRHWYTNPKPYSTAPDHSSPTEDYFDPAYQSPHDSYHPHMSYPYSPPSTESGRGLLPWTIDPPDYGPPVRDEVKEERLRMLQREFGPSGKRNARTDHDPPLIGGVDDNGKLVTQGPRKRIAIRVLQVILVLGAGVPSIYGALIIKPKSPPPPSGKLAAFALYILSILTFLLLTYLFVIRPCCMGKRSGKSQDAAGPAGMMVLPVAVPGAGKKGKKKKGKWKKGKGEAGADGVQVNLIVDPGMFGPREEEQDHHSQGEYDDDGTTVAPGSYSLHSHSQPRSHVRPRKSIFSGLAQESQWREARSWLKKKMWVDIAGTGLWGTLFILILMGKRCPVGQFEGWCTAYNVSSASACLLCVAFGVSVFFDVKDLHSSRASPRTR